MAAISDVATAISLIGKVIKAATNAQLMKKEFKELVDYLELVGKQFEMLDDRELGDASMQTLQKMEEVLLQCHDLAISCQQRSSIYLVVKGKRIQNELRGAQEKITKYLTLIPLIHFTQVFRRFKEEETNINENWHEHASNELDIPGEAGFPVLTWVQRLQIAYQAAQGLDYLHTRCNPPIVHRDVKSSNILLGADLEAKITDFGISKAWNENDTYTTTRVVGTVGYIDPAYFRTGYASDASDVYSFGIILLEMITGQPPIIRGPEVQQHIVQWISLRVTGEGDFVDTSMNEYYDPSSVWNVLQLALSCTDLSASRRPRMAEVVIQLKEIIEMKPLKQMTEDMNDKDMENEQVEEAFVTSIAQADRPICMHKLSANLFTSWTHNTPGRRFWRCKNWKMAGDCGFFKWHDPVQESVAIEQLDFVIHQSEELDEEIMILDEESAILFCKLKVLQEKLVECKRSKKALEMKLESMDRFYVHM
ncbi:probable LRR receptor-like serine/threonine-protein kinase At2g28960 isoform X2 [Zingiber officinale]|uniref:probable LRR receptor-like serine/threonine-protein kinase At2g28960 isoform X2 n=1 Tax=Zingiber officinale TaxID=94328 RepID=UPI001C4A77EB|nr:probable LRR receptor-like serine/threonine-protein kinase At2g28960 isoform X2 [Zingiber officinale]